MKPTIVLVHGAFADSASWDGVIDALAGAGHPVIAATTRSGTWPPTPPASAMSSARLKGRFCSSPTPTAER